tara:strand:- start:47 stop:571 length:525 start_codon:yes stop_codon:yes gene_type:complete
MVINKLLHKKILAWEIELQEDLNIDVKNLDYVLQDGLFDKVTTRFENHDILLKEKILNSLNLELIKEKLPEYQEIDIKIFKDTPGFKLWPHSDRINHRAFIMINLIDNVDSTTFYDHTDKYLCTASNKKNKGVFHILHQGNPTQHAIENTSQKDRYTAIAFFKSDKPLISGCCP